MMPFAIGDPVFPGNLADPADIKPQFSSPYEEGFTLFLPFRACLGEDGPAIVGLDPGRDRIIPTAEIDLFELRKSQSQNRGI